MRFFVLQDPQADETDAVTDFLSVEGSSVGDAPQCPVCGRFVGLLPLLPPVRVELQAWGRRWGDIAFGSGGILVSRKMKELTRKASLSGFQRFEPVVIAKVKRRQATVTPTPPAYDLANVQRGPAAIDASASGLVRDEPAVCRECRLGGIIKSVHRIVLEPNTWSGEDIFIARGLPGTIVVSERFKHLCDDNDVANCLLVPAEEFSFDDDRPKY